MLTIRNAIMIGQLADLLHILDANGPPALENKYIFNGDFVDRGDWGIEVMCVLMALQIARPGEIISYVFNFLSLYHVFIVPTSARLCIFESRQSRGFCDMFRVWISDGVLREIRPTNLWHVC